MRSFFPRIRLLFRGGAGGARRPPAKPVKGRGMKGRDPLLEERARALLLPWAPSLAAGVIAGWNPRMRTTAGVAVLSRHEIWLNPGLLEVSEAEVDRTLLHELAHLLAVHRHPRRRIQPHGEEWREACRDLGIPGEPRTHRLPFQGRRMKRRFLLRCPSCGRHHERVRRPRRPLACLFCCRALNGGVYDERFRLVVSGIERDLADHSMPPK
jgi:predicted SprT family Zn-dependent metalloprotease